MDESIKAALNQNINKGAGGKKVFINGKEITLDSDIMNLINGPAKLQAVKAVSERYGLGLKEAKDVVDQIQGVSSGSSSGKGCMITLLIVLTSSISAFLFL